MFILSVKSSLLKKLAAVFLIVLLTVIGGIMFVSQQQVSPAAQVGSVSLYASNEKERAAFLAQFGWQVGSEPLEIKETVIPLEFDQVYTDYNELQKGQGLDLEPYKGIRVKAMSYEVKNYPGYENTDGQIRANLLIYNNVIIGGDISNIALDGFMHGFTALREESSH